MDDDTSPSPSPTKPKRRSARVKAVQTEIITRRLSKQDVRTVAEATGVNTETVKDVFDEWWASTASERAEETENARELTLAGFRLAAAEAWTAWRESRGTIVTTAKDGAVTETPGGGNFRFLEQYQKALASVAKYEGLDAALALKIELSGPEGGPIEVDFGSMTDDELRKLAGDQ